jgi:hypothetical protein
MFVYRSRFLTRGEVWFDEEPDGRRVDWIYHRERSSPLPNCPWKDFYTRLIDLRKSPAQLFAEMEKNTARKITDAEEKDRLFWERCDAKDAKTMDEVERMWNEFAFAQKTALFERAWLDQISRAGNLDLSLARDPNGTVLAYHLVFLTPERARQLIAISPYRPVPDLAWRGAVSRANCFIHWKNFLTYKDRGISWFDFGGWYTGTTNMQYLGMNQFKKGFGGQVVHEFECEEIRTAKGWIALTVARILKRAGLLKHNGEASFSAPSKPAGNQHPAAKNCDTSPAV